MEDMTLFKDEYVFFDVDINTKNEALKFISHKAFELGLTDNESGLLSDFLKREEEFSTGLQDGFAIPHAKSDFAKQIAILYVRAKDSVSEWETLDDTKVTDLFALIVPKENAGNEHLLMISKLATSLLDDDFKLKVKTSTEKAKLAEYISKIIKEDM